MGGWEAREEAGGWFRQEAMKPETDRIVGVDISEKGSVREADHQQNHYDTDLVTKGLGDLDP